jgi:hypothetical protein
MNQPTASAQIDKSARFPYRRAFGQAAARLWRPFLSILQTDSILRNER